MNIGQAAEATGLTSKAIRHYETLGLVVPRRQEGNDYRDYNLQDLEELRFLQRARAVGFSLEEARQLLQLFRNPHRRSAEAKSLVTGKLAQLDQQWLILNQVRQTLMDMAQACSGNESNDCAIISQLSDSLADNPMRFRVIE